MSSVSGCGGFSAAGYQGLSAQRAPGSQRSEELFAKLDVNGDGSVDASEMKSLTDYLGQKTGTTVDSDALLKAIDTDGNGSISSTELSDNTRKLFDSLRGQLMGSSSQAGESQPPDADKMFAALDTNGDGTLSADEFKAGMKQHEHRGPPPAGEGSGHMIASLLAQYGTDSSGAGAGTLAIAA